VSEKLSLPTNSFILLFKEGTSETILKDDEVVLNVKTKKDTDNEPYTFFVRTNRSSKNPPVQTEKEKVLNTQC
jgi:hypothetical protein